MKTLIPEKSVVVVYKCPECSALTRFSLQDCPGNTCWVCEQCEWPENRRYYENFPKVIGVEINGPAR